MFDESLVHLSRLQFAITALYHFLFVPLTLGLSVMIAIMETVFVMTGRKIWRDMTKFWGILFGINFAMGVATGITMEFQFGTNWAYYSQFVGDIFGAPLAIEGLMAFFLEATFVGIFFFGWNKMSPVKHLFSTFLLALGTNLSALWILVANGWMQAPTGSHFNFQSMRMEVDSFYDVLFNTVAQAKFVHTVSAGYVTGAMFVLGISSYYLLRGKYTDFAKRSFVVAASFGLASALSVVVLGDESGYLDTDQQKMKIAAMEGMWETEKPPASFNLIGWPDRETKTTEYTVKIPYMLGIIATRSLDTPVYGINDLVERNRQHIRDGLKAYDALSILKVDPKNKQALANLQKNDQYLGYALLLKRYVENPLRASDADIERAAQDTVPYHLGWLFWSFRIMVGLGLFFIGLFGVAFIQASRHKFDNKLLLRIALFSIPLPWVAAELGWVVAEYGRQPWVVEGILPTFLGTSDLSSAKVWTTLIGFIIFYSILFVVEMYLMLKTIKAGPDAYLKLSSPFEITNLPTQGDLK